jgi:hypothetical protein
MRAANNRGSCPFKPRSKKETVRQSAYFRPACLICVCWWCISGCAGYQLGARTLYNPDIRTIYIPQVRNETWRHMLGVQLTEALQKEVELRTPYKVIANPSADSTLTCRVTTQTKRTVTETRTDEPRDVETMITVEVIWTDRRGNLLMENRPVPAGEVAFYFIQGSDFVPEGGQSMGTAQLRAIELLAQQIVSQMESRW